MSLAVLKEFTTTVRIGTATQSRNVTSTR